MPGLGNFPLSETLSLSHRPNAAPAELPDLTLSASPLKTQPPPPPTNAVVSTRSLSVPAVQNDDPPSREAGESEIKAPTTARAADGDGKGLEDRCRELPQKEKENKTGSEDPKLEFSLPFLVGAPKTPDCLVCRRSVFPGEEILCSVRGCEGTYHIDCAKGSMTGISNPKKFKCSRHVCVICKQKMQLLRCVHCPIAFHRKCAPWPEFVVCLKDRLGYAICWRHDSDWRQESLNRKPEASTSDIKEIFGRMPLPFVEEDFKVDVTWKQMDSKMEPPPYVHIRRNIYLVKKRNNTDDGAGCTTCGPTCSDNCMCRVQYISCSKLCRCSENCSNRPFRKEKKITLVKTELCGWGVQAAESIKKGEFIIEYIGEVIDDALCEKRLWDMKYEGAQNFYMCELRKDFTIDATYKGNMARFLNHSCDPKCVLEKWQVDGETRVGVFAAHSIEAGDPLTYDYRFVQFGPEVKCQCGAQNCKGFLGMKKKVAKVRELCLSKKVKEGLGWGTKRKRTPISAASTELETEKPV